ncbi:hypothetical protein WJ97_14540 [Burkholderia ubonensis]|uniref:hypothetical protein n=1 Tax=Burkholderia ubonensis TaxID=101571 RepID=UPI0007599CEB|nr:hypothetical protein [Burkholderia ubonensis]KVP97034.1 hypothetical protein WJ97_14540 [Burkholderia ubonensis]
MNFVEIGLKALAGLLAFFYIQPVLVWNNPNLYFFVGMLVVANQVLRSIQHAGLEPSQVLPYGVGIAVIALGILGPVFSGFSVEERIKVLGLPSSPTLAGLPVLDEHTVPLVSREVAIKAMQRKLEDAGLSMQFKLGSPVKQVYQHRLVWVAPLAARGYVKAFLGAPAPAYAIVAANDTSTARLVNIDINVNDRTLVDLDARVWFKNPTSDVYGWYFELDDSGRPHWIGILAQREVGFRGYDVVGAVALDVTTAKQTHYSRNEVPQWVNNKFPMEMVARQINAVGDTVNGLFKFSDAGKFELSSPLNMVYFEDRAWYLGTLSSVDKPDSIQEVVLVDTQTKAIRRIALQGITDAAAARLLEANGPVKGLRASNPVPYMVGGTPAYVASLADDEGELRAYGVVSVKQGVFAVGDTLHSALREFAWKEHRRMAQPTPELPPMSFDL